MLNSFLAIFEEIPCTIVHGLEPDFGATLEIFKKSNFSCNQPKFSTQHKKYHGVL